MTEPRPQVWPTLVATDARALIRFLVDAFGFTETVVHGDESGVAHAELAWPLGGGIMLGDVKDGGIWKLQPGTFGCYVVADDIDALHERAAKAGADIIKAPYDTDYGSRDFAARDPEGNLWQFGTYRGTPA
ncbi:VOC family protein [Paractinoplanes atraurantiacus]|nr:VOC family protein [Actinoplanes atraurantiacus]